MATVYGVQKTIIRASGGAAALVPKGAVDGRLGVMVDSYEAAALAGASQINLGDLLPVGARVVDVILFTDALGGDVTVDVGDAADDDRYMAAEDASSAIAEKHTDLIDGVDYVIGTTSGDNQVSITTSGGTTATGTIKVVMIYAMPS